ncbi:MAG: DUF4238 domain-containing protein [Oscillospiraceae bacterium]|nr:DUF4238 domain-containing protein [Oscillospiraceae bacterium]
MTSNQHYIPQFYQKYWECEKSGYLWEFDKRHRKNADKGIRIQAIRTRNSQKYLYEADKDNPNNTIENWYGKFENLYANRYKKLINNEVYLCRISDNDKLMLCRLFANFSARNPINLYNSRRNNAFASLFTLGEINPIIDRRYIQNIIAFAEGEMMEVFDDESKKSSSEMFGEFAKELYSCNIQILVSNKPNIVFCDNIIEQVAYPDEYYFPLCPTMLAIFSKEHRLSDKIVRRIASEEYMKFIQLYLKSKNVERIYANNRFVLENMT